VLIWGAFLLFLLLFMPFYDMRLLKMPLFFFASFGLLIAYYYFNSNFLVPRFLAQRKFIVFTLITLIILFVYVYMSDAFDWLRPPEMMTGNKGSGFSMRGGVPFDNGFAPPQGDEGMTHGIQPPRSDNGLWGKLHPGNPRNKFPSSSTLTFLLVFMVSTGTRIITSWFMTERQKNQAERDKYIAELTALKAQLNPHFLFNTLNSIYYLARKKSDSTPDMILKLSNLMRFVLTDTKTEWISLEKEVGCIQEYIDLQRLRLTDKTKVVFEQSGEVTDQLIAPLLLLPFVENAFKYGVSSRTSSTISIFLSINKNKLVFIVRNGKMNSVSESESTGTGLKNVKRRLDLSYPDKHALMIQETDEVFAAELKIILS